MIRIGEDDEIDGAIAVGEAAGDAFGIKLKGDDGGGDAGGELFEADRPGDVALRVAGAGLGGEKAREGREGGVFKAGQAED